MSKLTLPELEVGMLVLSPNSHLLSLELTPYRKYAILKLTQTSLYLKNDQGSVKPYSRFLFMEADAYYMLLMWLTMTKVLNLNWKDCV